MYTEVKKCRICGNANLPVVLDLGMQMMTGVFPREKGKSVTTGPLRLVKCFGESDKVCGLLQLQHTFDLVEMYGMNYGYRSGLNQSMVSHLHAKVRKILDRIKLSEGDLVVDIGSNDSTTLQAYPSDGPTLVGVDPTGVKFKKYYPEHVQLIPDFFSAAVVRKHFPDKPTRVVTSFSMFYDLESPMQFMQEVYDILADGGIWVFEQSYMPTMLEMNSYDTVCHEHLEYYSLHEIKWMADRVGFKIVDVEFNDVNGGSFSVTVAKTEKADSQADDLVEGILNKERSSGLHTLEPYKLFAERVSATKSELLGFIKDAHAEGKTVVGLGASTKGNVLLQYCGLTSKEMPFVGEVNPDKFGCLTPGTWIPIIPEEELLSKKPDYLIVLPWHFGAFFAKNPKFAGSNLLTPLPKLGPLVKKQA